LPSVDQDWLIRLRKHLGIKTVGGSQVATPVLPKPKPVEADLPLAKESTPHPAGSIEKIAVMRQRAANGEAIFHPHDNREILVRQSHSCGSLCISLMCLALPRNGIIDNLLS
jgi:hypothetical protein